MAYADQDDIEAAAGGEDDLLQIADWDGDGSVDAAAITHGQDYADMLIDGHAGIRFRTLLDAGGTISDKVRKLAASEAVYQIKCAKRQNTENDDRLADARMATYRDIRDGKFDPSPIDEAQPAASPDDVSGYIERSDTSAENAYAWSREEKW